MSIDPFTGKIINNAVEKQLTEEDKNDILDDRDFLIDLANRIKPMVTTGGGGGGGGGGVDVTAWHRTGDVTGAEQVMGSTDLFPVSLISDGDEIMKLSNEETFVSGVSTAVNIMTRDLTYSGVGFGITLGGDGVFNNNTWTYDTAGWATGAMVFSPTIEFSATSNGFITGILFAHSAIYKNDPAFTPGLQGPVYTMVDNSRLVADTNASNYFARTTFWDQSGMSTINGGTMAVTEWWSFRAGNESGGEVDSGVTVTDRYKFGVSDSLATGTITNLYSYQSDAITGGTNNYGIALGNVGLTGTSQLAWFNNLTDSTDSQNGIAFGLSRDTNLYRGAANTLQSDDTFRSLAPVNGFRYLDEDSAQTASVVGIQAFGSLLSANTHTMSGASLFAIGASFAGRFEFDQAPNAFLTGIGYNNGSVYVNENGTAIAMSASAGYSESGKLIADGAAVTATTYTGFAATNSHSVENAGTLALTTQQSFASSPTIGAGVTVTDLYGLKVDDPVNTGTITTNYGVYIEDQTAGTTDYNIYSAGTTAQNVFEGTVQAAQGSPTSPGYTFTVGSQNTGMYTNSGGTVLQFTAGGSEALRIQSTGNLQIFNDINHDGTMIGFFGTAPANQAPAYTPTNVTTDRTFDANSTTIDEIADVLGTLIADLQSYGLVQ